MNLLDPMPFMIGSRPTKHHTTNPFRFAVEDVFTLTGRPPL